MLIIHNLSVSYGEVPVFTDISVQFNPGKITGIIGPNGAGKSTLIKALLGLVKTKKESVIIMVKILEKFKRKLPMWKKEKT